MLVIFFFFKSLGILLSIKMTLIHFKRGLRFQAVSGLLCVTLEISPSSVFVVRQSHCACAQEAMLL